MVTPPKKNTPKIAMSATAKPLLLKLYTRKAEIPLMDGKIKVIVVKMETRSLKH